MAFIDDIGRKISQTSQDAVKRTRGIADISRINSKINAEESNINNLYNQIGSKYYSYITASGAGEGDCSAYVLSDAQRAELFALCCAVSQSAANIQQYRDEIIVIKDVKKCPNCGAECPKNVQFCALCGTPLPAIAETLNVASQAGFCSGCGAPLAPGTVFCTSCGTRVG